MTITDTITNKIETCINEIAQTASKYPGVVIIINIQTLKLVWMSERGLKQLGTTIDGLTGTSLEEYHERYFNAEDAKDYSPKITEYINRNNDDEIVTYFQQVRFHGHDDWAWHLTSSRILLRGDDGSPLLIMSMAFPIDAMHHMAAKATRLLEENNFLRRHYASYCKLSTREREVLRSLALGKSAAESAQELFITINTVETHRKNIRQKLNTASFYELSQYARAFDLI